VTPRRRPGTSACTRSHGLEVDGLIGVLLELPVGTREPQEVLDDSLEAVAFTPIRSSADRYDCASRSLLRAMDTSASMTLSGVLSSCEASAVNSRWRRCARAIGERARMPTTYEAPYIKTRSTAPKISSALTNESRTRSTSARLSPLRATPI